MDSSDFETWLSAVRSLTAAQRGRAFRELTLAEAADFSDDEDSDLACAPATIAETESRKEPTATNSPAGTRERGTFADVAKERFARGGCPHCHSPEVRSWAVMAAPPSQQKSVKGGIRSPNASFRLAASRLGRTASNVAPLRSRATTTGICSADRPRLAALPPRRRAGLARPPRRPLNDSRMKVSSASTTPERRLGLSKLRAARNRCRHRKAVLG